VTAGALRPHPARTIRHGKDRCPYGSGRNVTVAAQRMLWVTHRGRTVVVGGRITGMVDGVTETRALDEVISEALAVIDKGLGDLLHRELVSTNEVADLLLDVRTLLSSPTPDREADDDVVVAS
jgi:hypothetical protein